jgi:hypothetical protein
MLRNAEHKVTLEPPTDNTTGETGRYTYATVASLTIEERQGVYSDFNLAAVSVRIDDGGPIQPGWKVVITTPAPLAGTYTVKLVQPNRDHVRIVADNTL